MQNLITILFLAFLEGILSLDNALVLAALVQPLPEQMRKKALTYGIVGAFAFRAISIFFITHIISAPYIKYIGGAYLIFVAIKYFVGLASNSGEVEKMRVGTSLLRTIVAVELMDIAFSIDSILALVGVSQVYWIILTGAILGIIMMRFAASLFTGLLTRFPGLEWTAYTIVLLVGSKLILEQIHIKDLDYSIINLVFYTAYGAAFVIGLCDRRKAVLTGLEDLPEKDMTDWKDLE